jgi:P-type Cu2+ transporter
MLGAEPGLPVPGAASARAGVAIPGVVPDVACSHCGLNVAVADIDVGASYQFCCAGCRIVFGMLRQHELGGYYEHRVSDPEPARPALATGRDYAEFDEPAFLELYARRRGGERTLELLLEGVHCAACVWLVEKLPQLVPGVTSCRLDYARRLAYVTFDDVSPSPEADPGSPARPFVAARGSVKPSLIAQTLDRLGYPPHAHREGRRAEVSRREHRDLLARLAVAGACAGNSMLFALALYSGAFADMQPGHVRYFRLLSALVAVPSVTWSAQVFYRGALGALRARRPHMDLPLSLGIVLAALWGAFNVLRGQGEIYFDSLTMLIFVLLAARYVQLRQQARAESGAGAAHALAPRTARQLDASGAARVVPAESLALGARVEVLAGDAIPIDGHVESGHSSLDTSWLSGESHAQPVQPGSAVFAGTTNLGGRLVVLAETSGAETRAARIGREVERASLRRAPIALLADKVSGYFLLGVLALAGIAFFVWLPSGVGVALDTAIALLIVTCPCGLALATPLSVSAALGQAARAGWLIKGGACFEALARPALIVFDKTGTLTEGRLALVCWIGDVSLKPQVKALEAGSSHPIARALVQALAEVPAASARDCRQRLGWGVEGVVDGRRVSVGAVHSVSGPLDAWAEAALAELMDEGLSPVLVAVDGQVSAVLGLGDPIRSDAAATLRRLREAGYRLAVLSGDRQQVVDHLVRQLEQQSGSPGLFASAFGDMSPEDKLARIEQAHAQGNVFMVGDGVNDAAALAAASVGIAVHGGAEASLDAAHVFATRAGVAPIFELVAGARRTLGVIHTNLAFSLVYNVLAASLCLAGVITPLWAALLMPLSSLTVVSHSYRRRMFREPS